jgi:hypothetical protein
VPRGSDQTRLAEIRQATAGTGWRRSHSQNQVTAGCGMGERSLITSPLAGEVGAKRRVGGRGSEEC